MGKDGTGMQYEAILLGAGQGKRMQAAHNKILLHLRGKPVIVYALETFLNDPKCVHLILVSKKEEQNEMKEIVAKYMKRTHCQITYTCGGAERQDSVYAGLKEIKDKQNYVMVHDGARPFIVRSQLKQLCKTVEKTQAGILGVPVKDTIKRVENGRVVETIPRENLWQIQTPQMFLTEELLLAHEKARADGFLGTDEASLIEKYAIREISMVLGSYENIKLTTPEDMILGEAILRRR